MPEQVQRIDVEALHRVNAALLDARRELIDLSRRNRLLHSPLSGSQPHCLEITNADPDWVFSALTRASKQFGFLSFTDRVQLAAGDSEADTKSAEPAKSQSLHLQTKLALEALERRLLKLFREARTHEEEQGVNILFLAIGFLEWFEDPHSQERCFAPLLLVPVSLERRQGREQFFMRGREDDMVVNVSLTEKLRTGFSTNLPELPDGDEWLPSGYFDLTDTAIAAQKRWRVDRLAMGLGFFSFSKFLMWRDLDANAWSDPNKLLENRLIVRLLGETVPRDQDEPLVSDSAPIDQCIDLATAVHVLDADSSQSVCVEEARLGRNLVIQGPPGTGKSQTIANIIATAVHEGKTVLFLAEKAAALDVVHSRLKAVGLEALCLESIAKRRQSNR